MGLVIKFLGQPYPGREITVDDAKGEVRFGRGIDCDVGFPEDMAIVSRDHFALKKELGGYKFVINREKPVFLNGRPVYDDQDMPKSAEIQLSGPTGPKLRVERTEGGPSNQIKTEILKPQKDLVEVVRQTKSSGNRTLGLLAGVAALVAALGVGGYLITQNLREDIIKVSAELPVLKAETAALAGQAPANLATIIEKNKNSVYLVSIQLPSGTRMGGGTASVVLLPDGTKALATNSHVADILKDIESDPRLAGASLVAVQPKGPEYQALRVTKVLKHPGYDVLGKWQEDYFVKAHTFSATQMEFVPGFDVALLYVEDQTQLGEPLTYASREELANLKAGQQIVMIGYPSEQLNGTDLARPEPTSQAGIITSLTTFFLSQRGAKEDVLIQHSVPATGGASGSPMFNTKGEVVAFLNAGNIIMYQTPDGGTMRQPSAALVNYAQRADLLLDVAEGKADGNMPAIMQQLADADKELTKTPEVFIKDLVAYFGQELGDQNKVAKVAETEAVMDQPVEWLNGRRGAGFQVEITEPGIYVFAGSSLDRRIVQASIYEVMPDGSVTRIDEGVGLTPHSFVVNAREAKGKIFVLIADMSAADPAADKSAPGKVKIWVYRGTN
jgi:hypothetical protein